MCTVWPRMCPSYCFLSAFTLGSQYNAMQSDKLTLCPTIQKTNEPHRLQLIKEPKILLTPPPLKGTSADMALALAISY